MNKHFLILLTFSSMVFTFLFAQELHMPNISVEAQYKGAIKVPMGATTSIQPHYFGYKIVGYDYQIKLIMTFRGNSTFIDSLFGIVCILPDYSVEKYYFHSNSIIVHSDQEYEYSFPLRIKESGSIQIFVASTQEMLSDSDVRFYKLTSNKERMYLKSSSE